MVQAYSHFSGLASKSGHNSIINTQVNCSINKSPHSPSLRCSQTTFTNKITNKRQISATMNQSWGNQALR